MAVFMQPIYTQTVGAGGVSSITFNNIPQGFTDLKLVVSARASNSDFYSNAMMSFNGNTDLLFTDTIMYANGTTVTAASNSYGAGAVVLSGYVSAATSTANTFGIINAYIPSYTSGNFKQIILDSVAENNNAANYLISASAALWRNTSPITSLTINSGGNNFVQYSTFTLYGISNVYDTGTPTAPTIGTVTDQSGFASVAFTPASNDRADSYVVTSSPSGSTTYGAVSPITTPAVLGTSYTYQVAAVNSLGSSASSASAALTTDNSYASIATANATGTASAIYFNNIPQNYTHLQLRGISRSASTNLADYIVLQYNGSSGNVYSAHSIEGDGSVARYTAVASTNGAAPFMPGNSSTANNVGGYIIDILEYTNRNKNKTMRVVGGWTDPATSTGGQNYGVVGNFSAMQTALAPVSSIQIQAYVNFSALTSFALYGIA